VIATLTVLLAEATTAVAEKEPKNPILPKGNEILWAFVFFALLFAALRFVLVPPIQRMTKERDDKVRGDLDAAERTKGQLAAVRADYEAALAGARAEADRLIEQARAEADVHRAQLQAEADAEIASLRRQAQAEIAAARAQALASVKADVVELAIGAASAVVQRPVDRAASAAVVEQALRAV
jgi:F-type H+-transporting ATPase subunit b